MKIEDRLASFVEEFTIIQDVPIPENDSERTDLALINIERTNKTMVDNTDLWYHLSV